MWFNIRIVKLFSNEQFLAQLLMESNRLVNKIEENESSWFEFLSIWTVKSPNAGK